MTTIGSGDYKLWNIVLKNSNSDVPKIKIPPISEKTIDIEKAVAKFNKIEKTETIQNEDGTTTIVETYTMGYSVSKTTRKDKDGNEYEEKIQKNSDGSLRAKTIKTKQSEETKFYDKDGHLESEFNKTFKDDGKTVKTEDNINYQTDKQGNSVVKNEVHKYENGDKVEVYYDDETGHHSAVVTTKVETAQGWKSVEKHFDMTGVDTIRGEAYDENGNIKTVGEKEPRITSKITNKGLPTETRSYYTYNDNGSIEERIVTADGIENIVMYDNEDDFNNGITSLDKAAEKLKKEGIKLHKATSSDNSANKTQTSKTKTKTKSPTKKTGYTPKVGAQSRYHKGFTIIEINDDGTFIESDNKSKKLLCNKNGEVIRAYKFNSDGTAKATAYSKGKATSSYEWGKDHKQTGIRQHDLGITGTKIKTSKGETIQMSKYDNGRVKYYKHNPQTGKYDVECDKNGNPIKK